MFTLKYKFGIYINIYRPVCSVVHFKRQNRKIEGVYEIQPPKFVFVVFWRDMW